MSAVASLPGPAITIILIVLLLASMFAPMVERIVKSGVVVYAVLTRDISRAKRAECVLRILCGQPDAQHGSTAIDEPAADPELHQDDT